MGNFFTSKLIFFLSPLFEKSHLQLSENKFCSEHSENPEDRPVIAVFNGKFINVIAVLHLLRVLLASFSRQRINRCHGDFNKSHSYAAYASNSEEIQSKNAAAVLPQYVLRSDANPYHQPSESAKDQRLIRFLCLFNYSLFRYLLYF